ncbi:MAG TPA: hypothetical protein VD886_24605 [Herpetosiphonaceae bacterium]|nr:hypothetical protein [Herpetosiphonaceae bacterium]
MKRWIAWLLIAALAGCGAASSTPTAGPAAAGGGSGAFILGQKDDLWRFDAASKQTVRLTNFAPAAAASQPALSPDGSQVVYSYRPPLPTPSPDQPFVVPRTSLQLMPVGGGSGAPLHGPLEGFDSLNQAAWSPDGATIYAHYETLRFNADGVFTGSGNDVVTLKPGDQTITPLIKDAMFPAPSPDGTRLAFVRTVDNAPLLMLYDLKAKTEELLLQDANFSALEAPTWSADGSQIYLAVSPITLGQAPSGPLGWLRAGSASAHGLGWRVWRVDVAQKKGVEINKQVFEDPRMALQGDDLTLWTLSGLWQIDLRDPARTPALIYDQGDIGGIAALP